MEVRLSNDVENIFPCRTINEFLEKLEIGSQIVARGESYEALWFSYLHPETLNAIETGFYPQLAKWLEQPVTFVSGRLRRTA